MNTIKKHRGAYCLDECLDRNCVECNLRSSGRHRRLANAELAELAALADLNTRVFGEDR